MTSPWERDRYFASNRQIWGADGMLVCVVEDRGGETPDIARMIEAAPDMRAALEYIIGWKSQGWSPEKARELARAALAKVNGL